MHRSIRSELGEVALAAVGLWLLVRFAIQAIEIALSIDLLLEGDLPIGLLLAPSIHGLVGGVFFFGRRRLSLELFGSDSQESTAQPSVTSELQDFLVSLMGLWFVCSGIVHAAETEQHTLLHPSVELSQSLYDVGRPRALVTADAWIARAPYLVELVVGAALFASSGRVVELWTRLRRVGHVKESALRARD